MMLRATLYFLGATALNFLLMEYAFSHPDPAETAYYSAAFGLSVSAAYYLDTEKFNIRQKAAISFGLMAALAVLGAAAFGFDAAVPAVMVFAAVFFGYYLVASLRGSKSLRR